MKRLLITTVAFVLATAPAALAAIATGAKAPEITAKAYENGVASNFSLASSLRRGPVVLYFFPGAFTPGCNIEAQEFAASIDQFKAAGATVVGATGGFGNVARTSAAEGGLEEAVRDFSKEHCNGKFPVIAVTPATVAAYDVPLTQRPGWSNRTSFVIAPDGKILLAHTASAPSEHITKSLEAVRAWKAAH